MARIVIVHLIVIVLLINLSYAYNDYYNTRRQLMERRRPQISPSAYGLAPIIIEAKSKQQPRKVPQYKTPNEVYYKDKTRNKIDFENKYYNTPTGITLDKIPPPNGMHRPPPPINHAPQPEYSFWNRNRREIELNQELSRPNNKEYIFKENVSRKCAIAVLQCCHKNIYNMRCFESRGCPGPFFDNPCDNELSTAIVNYVNTYN